MARISRSRFLALKTLPQETVEIPGEDPIDIGTMTASERDRYEVGQINANKASSQLNSDFRARLIAATARDEEGKPLFTEDDIPAIGALGSNVLEPLVAVALRLNQFTSKDVDKLAKNSPTNPSSDSPSV